MSIASIIDMELRMVDSRLDMFNTWLVDVARLIKTLRVDVDALKDVKADAEADAEVVSVTNSAGYQCAAISHDELQAIRSKAIKWETVAHVFQEDKDGVIHRNLNGVISDAELGRTVREHLNKERQAKG